MKRISFQLILPIIGVVAVSAAAVYGIAHSPQPSTPDSKPPITCERTGVNHTVTIQGEKVSPSHTDGHLCDTLTIKNLDSVTRFMAFGQHDHHQSYDGVTKDTLDQNQSFTITMDQAGEFMFHDHAHDEVEGTFTVQ